MGLIAILQAPDDLHGVLYRRLAHQHRLKTPLKGGVFLYVLAVLINRRRPDDAELPAGEGGLEHVRGVHRTLGGAGPDRPSPSLAEVLAARAVARALYLDALRGLLYGCSLDGDLENAVLEAGVDLAVVNPLGQRYAAAEGAVTALPDVVATTLLFLVDLVLAGDGQEPVLKGDVHILLLESGKLGADHQVVVLGEHVHGWRPFREPLASLAPAAQAPQHLVEEAIHLTLHIVKPTERTQHDPCTSFSPWPPIVRGQTPYCTDIIYPFIQFSTNFLPEFCLNYSY